MSEIQQKALEEITEEIQSFMDFYAGFKIFSELIWQGVEVHSYQEICDALSVTMADSSFAALNFTAEERILFIYSCGHNFCVATYYYLYHYKKKMLPLSETCKEVFKLESILFDQFFVDFSRKNKINYDIVKDKYKQYFSTNNFAGVSQEERITIIAFKPSSSSTNIPLVMHIPTTKTIQDFKAWYFPLKVVMYGKLQQHYYITPNPNTRDISKPAAVISPMEEESSSENAAESSTENAAEEISTTENAVVVLQTNMDNSRNLQEVSASQEG